MLAAGQGFFKMAGLGLCSRRRLAVCIESSVKDCELWSHFSRELADWDPERGELGEPPLDVSLGMKDETR